MCQRKSHRGTVAGKLVIKLVIGHSSLVIWFLFNRYGSHTYENNNFTNIFDPDYDFDSDFDLDDPLKEKLL